MSKNLNKYNKDKLIEMINEYESTDTDGLRRELNDFKIAYNKLETDFNGLKSENIKLKEKYDKLSKDMIGDKIEVTLSGHWGKHKPNQTILVSMNDYRALLKSGGIKNIRS